jgi:hypothetical protein
MILSKNKTEVLSSTKGVYVIPEYKIYINTGNLCKIRGEDDNFYLVENSVSWSLVSKKDLFYKANFDINDFSEKLDKYLSGSLSEIEHPVSYEVLFNPPSALVKNIDGKPINYGDVADWCFEKDKLKEGEIVLKRPDIKYNGVKQTYTILFKGTLERLGIKSSNNKVVFNDVKDNSKSYLKVKEFKHKVEITAYSNPLPNSKEIRFVINLKDNKDFKNE